MFNWFSKRKQANCRKELDCLEFMERAYAAAGIKSLTVEEEIAQKIVVQPYIQPPSRKR